MIVYLSFVTDEESADFLAWAERHLSIQQPDFQVRFGVALNGLAMATPRAEFQNWTDDVADRFGYLVRYLPVGPEEAEVGAPSQLALFAVEENAPSES